MVWPTVLCTQPSLAHNIREEPAKRRAPHTVLDTQQLDVKHLQANVNLTDVLRTHVRRHQRVRSASSFTSDVALNPKP